MSRMSLMMKKLLLLLVVAENILALPLPCLPSQPVEAVEGGSATLQCRLDPPIDLSTTTVEWNRGHTRYVHVYRSRRDDPDSQMLQYRDRTALNHGDLTRGVLTLTISNVSLSNNGSYEVYLPQLEVRCSTHLTVVTKEQENQTKRNDSSTTSPPAGERNDASNREAGRAAIILTVLLILVLVVLLVLKSGKIRICKKEGEPKTSEGDQQSAAEEGLVGSEVKDNNNQPSDTVY